MEQSSQTATLHKPAFVFNTIPEILEKDPENQHGSMVRTIGKLKHFDVQKRLVTVEDFKSPAELAIDCRVIEPFPFQEGALYQFCGELDGSRTRASEIVLKAHVYRCVNGLDMDIYMKALAIIRATH